MADSNRVAQLWNWLPAFRAVAETQHLPTASKELHISASALSRAVRLLEDELGRELFERSGRQLTLSPPGERLLAAVREAMQAVNSGIDSITTTAFEGPVQISAPGPYAAVFVLPALQAVREDYPHLTPIVSSVTVNEVNAQLLTGQLDIALLDDPQPHDSLTVHRLGALSFGVYCGVAHPLAGRQSLLLEEVVRYRFVGPPPGLVDHWPRHVQRRLGMVATQMHVAVQAIAAGDFLGVLPDAVASAYRGSGALYRLPLELVEPTTLYAVTNHLPEVATRVEIVLDAIRARGP